MTQKKSTTTWRCLSLLFIFMAYSIVSGLLAMLLSKAPADYAAADSKVFIAHDVLAITTLFSALVAIALAVVCGLVRRHCGLGATRVPGNLAAPERLGAGGWLMALGGGLLIAVGLSFFVAPFDLDDGGTSDLFADLAHEPLGLLLLVIVGPLLEEVFFREGLARQLFAGGCRPWGAAMLSALIFAVCHANMAQFITATILGYLLGLFYFRTGNIRLSLAFHILNNALGTLTLAYPAIDESIRRLPTAVNLGSGAALIIAGSLLVWRVTRIISVTRPYVAASIEGPTLLTKAFHNNEDRNN